MNYLMVIRRIDRLIDRVRRETGKERRKAALCGIRDVQIHVATKD